MVVSSEELQSYKANGFLVKRALATEHLIVQVKQELDDIHQRMLRMSPADISISWEDPDAPDENKLIQQLMNSEVVSPALNQILRSDRMLDLVELLMSPDISLYHSKLLPKEAGQGKAIPWHQDYAYWKTEENRPFRSKNHKK